MGVGAGVELSEAARTIQDSCEGVVGVDPSGHYRSSASPVRSGRETSPISCIRHEFGLVCGSYLIACQARWLLVRMKR